MARILIIGYGNPLRNDDSLGWRVADALQDRLGSQSEVEILRCQQLNPELADPISRASMVIFVDAEHPEATSPGDILERDLEPNCMSPGCFSHDLTPSTLLACAAELFGSSPKRAKMFSIVGEDFGMGEHLSPAVSARVPELVSRVSAAITLTTVPRSH